MSFIRPQAAATLSKARPFILAGCMASFGIYIMLTTRGAGYLAAGVFILIAGLIAHDAYRRIMFPKGSGGVGLVEVDERRITYLSGGGGHSISIEDLTRVEAHRNGRGRVTWVFYSDEETLSVPANAMGNDKLFDAMVALPGLNHEQAQAAARGQGPDMFLVWQRDKRRLH
ncbi:MAG: hypothetical protein ACPG5U_07175 [Planktomarina sp.]